MALLASILFTSPQPCSTSATIWAMRVMQQLETCSTSATYLAQALSRVQHLRHTWPLAMRVMQQLETSTFIDDAYWIIAALSSCNQGSCHLPINHSSIRSASTFTPNSSNLITARSLSNCCNHRWNGFCCFLCLEIFKPLQCH